MTPPPRASIYKNAQPAKTGPFPERPRLLRGGLERRSLAGVAGGPPGGGRGGGRGLSDGGGEGAGEAAARVFERASEMAAECDRTVEPGVGVGQPAGVIAACVGAFDAVVLGTHSSSLADRLLVGNVAKTVFQKSPVPVTVVR